MYYALPLSNTVETPDGYRTSAPIERGGSGILLEQRALALAGDRPFSLRRWAVRPVVPPHALAGIDPKQSGFALDHPLDDRRQTDFAHRFTDELKAVNDSPAANFDSAKKITEYTGDERKQLAYATGEAFRAMDFDSNETGSPPDSPSNPDNSRKMDLLKFPLQCTIN